MVVFLKLDLRSATHFADIDFLIPTPSKSYRKPRKVTVCTIAGRFGGKFANKPSICTADELHYVPVPNSLWRLALWRYTPSSQGPKRNHPLLLLSGVGTNAIGYDLGPGSSFARYMSSQGFDTWILEVRGAGLSIEESFGESLQHFNTNSSVLKPELNNGISTEDRNSGFSPKSELSSARDVTWNNISGLLQTRLNSAISSQVKDWRQKLANIIQEGQRSILLQQKVSSQIDGFQKQLDMFMKYDWDFDHYLEEDLPAAMEYIRNQCQPKDNKLLAIGHSMGGILLYAMLSRNGYKGRNCGLASVVTLASSVDYSTSRSSLKLLLPIIDPAQALSVPVIPLGALMAAAYPLASRPPYFLSWLNPQISAQNMMHPEMFEKLVLNNFGTIPSKLLLQLATVFQDGGLRDRTNTFFFKDHMHKIKVPVLALAGDQDLICPPEAAYETIKLIPEHFITYKVLGEPGGPHFGHYDLVGSRLASDQVYPCIIKHLTCHDTISFS